MTEPQPVTVVIADDHPILRDGLRRLLEAEREFVIVGEASTAEETIQAVGRLSPALLLLDLLMPGGGGIAVLDALRPTGGMASRTKVILLTAAIERHEQLAAAELGVRGIIMKESATARLIACMRAVVAGDCWFGTERVTDLQLAVRRRGGPRSPLAAATLTPRELDIIAALVKGATNMDIAAQFDISRQTVKNHLSVIFEKLGVSTRLELALHALEHNLLARRPPGRSS